MTTTIELAQAEIRELQNTVAAQAECIAAFKPDMQDFQREFLALRSDAARDKADAERYRWLRQYIRIMRSGIGSWTAWLALAEIPYRWSPENNNEQDMLDSLMQRFPPQVTPQVTPQA